MPVVLGVLAALFLVLLVVGAVTGRVRITACCRAASEDLRMREAFDPDAQEGPVRDNRTRASR
ncbi:hypothetical protein [Nocardioides mesophilus]|uniref:Uncharacterized protein n=1 Tax=Nocardioides mesophilus TaxID=433659 RepID=A0A7G9R890_9ACTN|nr:hypothetical protein [Nocardioides mesophilus]QNN51815.1 hypothetical protein H9L09_14880 [Nocardioides mesophilus]